MEKSTAAANREKTSRLFFILRKSYQHLIHAIHWTAQLVGARDPFTSPEERLCSG
jgi:hypothetical protein